MLISPLGGGFLYFLITDSGRLTQTLYLCPIVTFCLSITVYEIVRTFANRKWRHADFSTRGRFFEFFHNGFWEADPNFLLIFNSNFSCNYIRFRDNHVFVNRKWRHADFSARGRFFELFHNGFWIADPNFILVFNTNFSSICNRFEVIRLLKILAEIPLKSLTERDLLQAE